MFNRFTKKSGNAKIKNAVKVVDENGVKFDSRLEKYASDTLKQYGISFLFQHKYILVPGFKYRNETIRPITLTVDFWLPELNVIIDTKGFQTEQSKIKMKMLKAHLLAQGSLQVGWISNYLPPEICLPSSKKAVNDLVILMKSRMS